MPIFVMNCRCGDLAFYDTCDKLMFIYCCAYKNCQILGSDIALCRKFSPIASTLAS